MVFRQLFIIGNGFDLHHKIPSSYRDFGYFIQKKYPDTFQLIEDYLAVDDDFWNYFEERLAGLDYDSIINHAENFLASYSADAWRDSYHHDFEYEIEQIVEGLSHDLRVRFVEWIKGLPIPETNNVASKVRCIVPDSLFLNFNYTPTLQKLYNIPDKNVLHIHGKSSDPISHVILGHGWRPTEADKLSRFVDEETDPRVSAGYRLIDRYFKNTFKPTNVLISKNRWFFEGLTNVSHVWVLGHSLADVDAAYIEEILKHISSLAKWTISYYGTSDSVSSNFAQFNVQPSNITFRPMAEL